MSILGFVLVVFGCLLFVWGGVTWIEVEQAISEDPFVKRVGVGPPIAIFFGLGFMAVGAWQLYVKRNAPRQRVSP